MPFAGTYTAERLGNGLITVANVAEMLFLCSVSQYIVHKAIKTLPKPMSVVVAMLPLLSYTVVESNLQLYLHLLRTV